MNKTKHTFIPPFHCLNCGYRMDCTTDAYGDGTPKDGDISMCLHCGHLMLFNKDMTVRELTPDERAKITCDPQVVRADIVRAAVVANKPKK